MEDKKEQEIIEEKKKKLINWINNKYNKTILGIVFFSFIINIYYFNLTKNQAHWWDSLAYGGLAKESILYLWSNNAFLAHEAVIRAPLLPLLWSILLRFNLSDPSIIFILEIIPSIISVYLVYLIGKELYDEKVGIISAFLFSTSWLVIFYTMRIMTDIPAMFFSLLSIYFFSKSYRNFNLKLFSLSIFFLSLAVLSRTVSYIIGGIFIVLILINKKHHFIKNKNFWIGGIIGIIPLIILFISNMIKYGNIIPSLSTYASSVGEKPGFAYYVITNFFPHTFGNVLLIFVILGLLLIIVELILGYGYYNKVKKIDSNILLFLILISFLIFYIFILRAAEDRYLLVPLVPLLIFASRGILYISDFIKKYNKELALLCIIIILVFSVYSQYKYGNPIIDGKKYSYIQMKEAFLWINENTPKDSVITGDGIPLYTIYYAERKIYDYNISNPDGIFANSDYIVLHRFEYQSQELINLVNENQKYLTPVYGNFFDSQKQQPAVIIYQINK